MAVNSGTVALQYALYALRAEYGKEVLIPSFTFVATANVVIVTRAKPIFVDILRKNFTMDLKDLCAKITPKSCAIILVHLYGRMAHMYAICKIALENNVKIIEDAAQTLGSKLNDRHVGTISDAGGFSLYPGNLTRCYDLGILITNDEHTYDMALKVRNHGMIKGYDTETFGLNLRMTEIVSAMARITV